MATPFFPIISLLRFSLTLKGSLLRSQWLDRAEFRTLPSSKVHQGYLQVWKGLDEKQPLKWQHRFPIITVWELSVPWKLELWTSLHQNLLQPFPHPNDASHKFESDEPIGLRVIMLKVWTRGRTDTHTRHRLEFLLSEDADYSVISACIVFLRIVIYKSFFLILCRTKSLAELVIWFKKIDATLW